MKCDSDLNKLYIQFNNFFHVNHLHKSTTLPYQNSPVPHFSTFTLKQTSITLDVLFLFMFALGFHCGFAIQYFAVQYFSQSLVCFFKPQIMYFSVLYDSFRLSLPKSALLTTPHTVCRGPGSVCVQRECVCNCQNVCVWG